MPVLFLMMFTGLQAALYYYASTVAGAAAQDGARAAAAYTGSGTGNLPAGTAAASSALQQSHGSLSTYTVTASGTVSGATVNKLPTATQTTQWSCAVIRPDRCEGSQVVTMRFNDKSKPKETETQKLQIDHRSDGVVVHLERSADTTLCKK